MRGGGGVVIAQSGRFRISIERVRDEYIFDVDVQLYNYGWQEECVTSDHRGNSIRGRERGGKRRNFV